LCEQQGLNLKLKMINLMKFDDFEQAINFFNKYILENIKQVYPHLNSEKEILSYMQKQSRTSYLLDKIVNAKNEIELFSVVNQIGFFTTALGDIQNASDVISKIKSYFNNRGSISVIPRSFGLRDKVVNMRDNYLSVKIANIQNENELYQTIKEIGFFPTSK